MSLESYTEEQLLAELLRRSDKRSVKRRRYCEGCRFFKVNPNASDSYNPCQKGHKMQFQAPADYGDDHWGFYRNGCTDRIR